MRPFYYFAFLCALLGVACAQDTPSTEKQIAQLQTRVTIDPNNTDVHYQLGRAYLSLGHYEEGASQMKDTVRLSKKHALAHRGGLHIRMQVSIDDLLHQCPRHVQCA